MSGTNQDTPRGFKPLRQVGGAPWSGALTTYKLPSATAQNIFTGDMIRFNSTGFVDKCPVNAQFRGIALGFKWVGANGVPVVSPYWPTGTVTLGSQPAEVLVVDDPNVLFEAVLTGAATLPTDAILGATFDAVDAGGSVASGLSGEGVDITTLATTAKPWRVLEFLPRPDNYPALAYARVVVAPALHDFRVNTGI